MIPGNMEGDASDMNINYLLQQGEADGPYHQTREGVTETTPIILGGLSALRLPGFFEQLGHSNVILTAWGGFGTQGLAKTGRHALPPGGGGMEILEGRQVRWRELARWHPRVRQDA